MDERRTVKVSKYLSRHLRHQPARIGLTLDPAGWVDIDTLITAAAEHGFRFTREELDRVVATNDKRRFTVDGARIRANQGHTVAVDLGLPPATPPPYLYHGTHPRALESIRATGLKPMDRHAVHLSPDRDTATRVADRRRAPALSALPRTSLTSPAPPGPTAYPRTHESASEHRDPAVPPLARRRPRHLGARRAAGLPHGVHLRPPVLAQLP
ncbi:RNA 2'-phosphotransferase [Streptomyces murinus]|uniref:RNA 2'-phosphotransferase n=1 Tax=Streptomyces murinus TaxID=33900 RepID=UPI002E167710|nr:RNA 2'-phosphotransferase [Streptomyces murinus]